MSNSEFQLFNYFRSSASYRARIALHYKQIPFEYVPVHLLRGGGEQYLDTYKEMNPLAQVPTLVHRKEGKSYVVSQSVAIIEYLEETLPNSPSLFPKDSFERALVRQAVETINSMAQPFGNLSTLAYLQTEFEIDDTQKEKWIQHWATKALAALERMSQSHGKTFSCGSSVTAADLFLIPQLFTSRRFKVDLNPYPKLLEIEKNCLALEPFQKAHPEKQIDFQV